MPATQSLNQKCDVLETKIPPPVVMVVCAAGAWLTHQLLFLPLINHPLSQSVTTVLAAIIFALGIGTDLLSLKRFWLAKTTVNPLKPHTSSHLVTSGIYRFTRNPMYVGLMLWLVAWAVYLNSLLCLIWPLIFVAYVTRFQIRPEERFLRELFGEEYLAYLKSTPRWLLIK